MPFLIDGDNLLGTWGRARSETEKRRISLELDRFGRRIGKKTLTIFDGPAPESQLFSGNVRFAGRGRSADDAILDHLRAQRDPKGWIVVTSDRSLADRCRWVGAQHLKCHEFRRRIDADAEHEKPDREDDLGYWLEQFGDES